MKFHFIPKTQHKSSIIEMEEMKIKFLNGKFPKWNVGFVTAVTGEDNENYFFNDKREQQCSISKSKENVDFLILAANRFICGGKGVTYKALKKKVKKLKK